MVAYERYIKVAPDGTITVSGLPVAPGRTVRVTVAVEAEERARLAREIRELLKQTQLLPQAQSLTEEEIAAEIDAVRRASAA